MVVGPGLKVASFVAIGVVRVRELSAAGGAALIATTAAVLAIAQQGMPVLLTRAHNAARS